MLAALIEQFDPFYSAVAQAESALLCDGRGSSEANAALWIFSSTHDLPQLAQMEGRLPLPLSAGPHGKARGIGRADAGRNMLVGDFR